MTFIDFCIQVGSFFFLFLSWPGCIWLSTIIQKYFCLLIFFFSFDLLMSLILKLAKLCCMRLPATTSFGFLFYFSDLGANVKLSIRE